MYDFILSAGLAFALASRHVNQDGHCNRVDRIDIGLQKKCDNLSHTVEVRVYYSFGKN